jgi:hypothetical protein
MAYLYRPAQTNAPWYVDRALMLFSGLGAACFLLDTLTGGLLGCTARRAVLGIHQPQAGRRGSSTGRRQRAEARSTTTTPPIDSATSVTGPGRSAAGRCRPCARPGARAGQGEKPPPPLLAAAAGPGAVRQRYLTHDTGILTT